MCVCVCVCVLTKFKTIIKSIYPYSLKNMIVFNVAIVGYWVAHGIRVVGRWALVQREVSSWALVFHPWSMHNACSNWFFTKKEEKFLIFGTVIALRDHFVPFDEKTEAKVGWKLSQGQISREHIESLYLHLALTVQKANVFIFITPVHPV